MSLRILSFLFFFNDTATTEIYTLSLHDALPILQPLPRFLGPHDRVGRGAPTATHGARDRALHFDLRGEGLGVGIVALHLRPFQDRKSTRLNSSHLVISYAVFCLKKKTKKNKYYV